jgi:AcrR family transcriptional regulator
MTNEAQVREGDKPRERVLAAAVRLFADFGFDGVSMQQIADEAAVARATPSYFFGSKEGLWKAVLDEQSRLVASILPAAAARLGEGGTPAALLDELVDAVFAFEASHESFYRLLGWANLQGTPVIREAAIHGEAVASALRAVRSVMTPVGHPESDAAQALLSVVALCAAHLSFGATLGPPLGVDMRDGAFLERRRAHLKRLLRAALVE